MAEKKSPAGAGFVAKIVKDPKNPPDAVLLSGYLGASSEDGHSRIYFDPGLGSYAEIPNDAILHTEAVEQDSLGASRVWIKRDAVLIHGPAGSQRPKGSFLEGPIMQANLGAAAAPIGPSQFIACQTWICPPTHPHCAPTPHLPCLSEIWICNPTPHCPKSDFVPCQSWICLPTVLPNLCMTAHCTAPPQCPILSGPPACPTVGACPSIACQSAICQPGGGLADRPMAAAAGLEGVPGPITLPGCGPFTLPPQCHPTLPPQCHPTLPPQCPQTLLPGCHFLTSPPQCPPTSPPLLCPVTVGPQCHPTVPPQCHPSSPPQCPQTLLPGCHFLTSPPQCPPTSAPLQCPHTVQPPCQPSLPPPCHPSLPQCHPTLVPPCPGTIGPPCFPTPHLPCPTPACTIVHLTYLPCPLTSFQLAC